MSGNWQVLSKSQNGALYLNPKNGSSNSLVRSNASVCSGALSVRSNARPIQVNVKNSKASLAFKCADDSPYADRLIALAERIGS